MRSNTISKLCIKVLMGLLFLLTFAMCISLPFLFFPNAHIVMKLIYGAFSVWLVFLMYWPVLKNILPGKCMD